MPESFKLKISTPTVELVLNTRRGLAISQLRFPKVDKNWLVGTIEHGGYDNVAYSADFYSGHTLAEVFGGAKITDLNLVEPQITENKEEVLVNAEINTPAGKIKKTYTISKKNPKITIKYEFDMSGNWSTFRTGKVTLNPDVFDKKTLFYECHNGGVYPERFYLKDAEEIPAGPISFSLSARGSLGNTNGKMVIGDKKRKLILENDLAECAALPILNYIPDVDGRPFIRVAYSLAEFDDTRINKPIPPIKTTFSLSLSLSATK